MEAKFKCVNCGKKVEKNMMPWKHAILGIIPSINRKSSCCKEPDYHDSQGIQKANSGKSFRQRIPNFA